MTIKCKKVECGSEDLSVIPNGPHQELVCNDCLAHQQFLGKKELKRYIAIQAQHKDRESLDFKMAPENDWLDELNYK